MGAASGREEADSMRINEQVLSGADPGHGVRGAEGQQTIRSVFGSQERATHTEAGSVG